VIISSCDFHTTAPVSLFSASRDSPGPPPPRNSRFPSITGEAALFQGMLRPACSLIRSIVQSVLPVWASRQESARSWFSTYTLPSLIVGVERGPSPPLLSGVPESPPPSYIATPTGANQSSLPVAASSATQTSRGAPSRSRVTTVNALPSAIVN